MVKHFTIALLQITSSSKYFYFTVQAIQLTLIKHTNHGGKFAINMKKALIEMQNSSRLETHPIPIGRVIPPTFHLFFRIRSRRRRRSAISYLELRRTRHARRFINFAGRALSPWPILLASFYPHAHARASSCIHIHTYTHARFDLFTFANPAAARPMQITRWLLNTPVPLPRRARYAQARLYTRAQHWNSITIIARRIDFDGATLYIAFLLMETSLPLLRTHGYFIRYMYTRVPWRQRIRRIHVLYMDARNVPANFFSRPHAG